MTIRSKRMGPKFYNAVLNLDLFILLISFLLFLHIFHSPFICCKYGYKYKYINIQLVRFQFSRNSNFESLTRKSPRMANFDA